MATRFVDHLLTGDHASRPAFGDVPQGTLYSCTDHDLIYQSDGSTAWTTWATVGGGSGDLPPGHEYVHTQITSPVNVTATAEASADTVVTAGSSVVLDGSTAIIVEVGAPSIRAPLGSNLLLALVLYEDSGSGAASIGRIATVAQPHQASPSTVGVRAPLCARRRFTPSAGTYTWSLRGFVTSGTGVVDAGAGGSGLLSPAYIRVTKAS